MTRPASSLHVLNMGKDEAWLWYCREIYYEKDISMMDYPTKNHRVSGSLGWAREGREGREGLQAALRNLLHSVVGDSVVPPDLTELTSLKVFFKDLNKHVVKQEPAFSVPNSFRHPGMVLQCSCPDWQMARLLMQIGGLSALLCGISILTLCECGEMLISFVSRSLSWDEAQLRTKGEECRWWPTSRRSRSAR